MTLSVPPLRRIVRYALMGTACLLLWLVHLALPFDIARDGLDPSWQAALGYALKHRVFLVLTYRPLAYFMTYNFDPALFWPRIAWELSIKLFAIVTLVRVAASLSGPITRVLFVLSLLLVPCGAISPILPPEGLYAIALLAVTVQLTSEPWSASGSLRRLLPGIAFITAISLTKLTFTMLAVACLMAITAMLVYRRRVKLAVTAWGVFVFGQVVGCAWSCPSWGAVVTLLRGSADIVSGYPEAMGLVRAEKGELHLALLALGTSLLLLLGTLAAAPRSLERVLLSVPFAVALVLGFQNGFVRHDIHAWGFFGSVAPIGLLVLGSHPAGKRRALVLHSLLLLTVALGVYGVVQVSARVLVKSPTDLVRNLYDHTRSNGTSVWQLRRFKATMDQGFSGVRQQWALPHTQAVVGTASLDFLSHAQGIVFLNGFNWHPRPVFQSYAAYTPYLLATNAAHFTADDRPEFVILRLQTIDSRLPTMDDGEVLKVLLRDYRPVLVEKGNVLLQAGERTAPAASQVQTLLERQVKLGEAVDVGDLQADCLLLSVDVQPPTTGRPSSILSPPPGLTLDVAVKGGGGAAFRLVPAMARSGFLFDPLLTSQETLLAWLNGKPVARVKSFRLLAPPGCEQYYKQGMTIRLGTDPKMCGGWRSASAAGIPSW